MSEIIIINWSNKTRPLLRNKYKVVHSDRHYRVNRTLKVLIVAGVTMTLFRRNGRVVQLILRSRELVTAGNWWPTSRLALRARRRGPWYSVGWWQSVYDMVSRVPAYTTGPRAKLVSDRY